MLGLCEEIGRRARDSAPSGEVTFALPEAEGAAAWVAATKLDPKLRAEASAWRSAGADYRALLSLCARAVLALDDEWQPFEARYREKVHGELDAVLALCPDVLVFPTAEELTPMEMVELRAFPIHPLGLVDELAWTDGALAPPSEFFFHDLDHARFKVREDLLVGGIAIPDAYQDGTTVDPVSGGHRTILSFARGRLGADFWQLAPVRSDLARRLVGRVAALGDGPRARAAELLLFEIIHEKSFSLDAVVLARELANDAHITKLQSKVDRRFFPAAIDTAVIDGLPSASLVLAEVLS